MKTESKRIARYLTSILMSDMKLLDSLNEDFHTVFL